MKSRVRTFLLVLACIAWLGLDTATGEESALTPGGGRPVCKFVSTASSLTEQVPSEGPARSVLTESLVVPASLESANAVEEFDGGYAANEWVGGGYDWTPAHSWVDEWDGSFDVGLNGSTGNSDTTNLFVGLDAKREWGLESTLIDVDYLFSQDNSVVSKNRLYALGRYERAFPDSVLSWYTDLWYEFDQLASFDSRIGFHTGVGILLLDTGDKTLKGRAGLGASREFGSMNTDWVPEIQFGLDYEHRLSDRQKLFAILNFYPDINDFSDFRLILNAGWECLIDAEWDLSLRASIFDRYYSRPDPGFEDNDLDYILSLSWGF